MITSDYKQHYCFHWKRFYQPVEAYVHVKRCIGFALRLHDNDTLDHNVDWAHFAAAMWLR